MSRLSRLVYVPALDKVLSVDDLLTIGGGFATLAMAHLGGEESGAEDDGATAATNGPWNETGAWGSGNGDASFVEPAPDTERALASGEQAAFVPEGASLESLVKPLGYGFYEVTLRGPDNGPLVQTIWLPDGGTAT